jgi:methyl-accepting chemotaxis protein
MKLSDIKLLYKILACFLLLGLVTAFGLWHSSSKTTEAVGIYSEMIDKDVAGMKANLRVNSRVYNFGRLIWRLTAETDPVMMNEVVQEVRANYKDFQDQIAIGRKALPQFAADFDKAAAMFDEIMTKSYPKLEKEALANNNEEASRLNRAMIPQTDALRDHVRTITTRLDDSLAKRSHEAAADVKNAVTSTVVIVGGAFLAVLAAAFALVQFGVARPIARLVGDLQAMARGQDVDVSGTERGDEIGQIANAVNDIHLMLAEKARREADDKLAADRKTEAERKTVMMNLANSFEAAVGEIVETVSSASTELEASARTLAGTSERSQERTTRVAVASEQASTNVQSVASATEEMSSSISEISRQVQDSARIATEAVEQARTTNSSVGELSAAAARIGDVVELINTIAGQTNLLALNATIEAARAGEAGRGFAVVASEVKALAEQTAKATGEISAQIGGIQSATDQSVRAIREIGETIAKMSEISSTIAAAVEQQGAATQEISRNVQQAAQGTQQVSSNIVEVQHGVTETGSASSQVLSAAQGLSRDSERLRSEVAKFLSTVRAA